MNLGKKKYYKAVLETDLGLPDWEGYDEDTIEMEALSATLLDLEVRQGEGDLPFYQGIKLGRIKRSGF